ncbi:conserved hypothetical protein [uncultured Gammaproteobacteria bacterium]
MIIASARPSPSAARSALRIAIAVLGMALPWISSIAAAATSEDRVALVIGNAAYPAAPLQNPVNDARDMAEKLRAVGFDVIVRENATKSGMESAIAEFGDRLHDGSVALVFYSGHGLQVGGRNFLVPIDAKIQSEQQVRLQTIDADILLDQLAAAHTRVNLVVLDACRNNPFERARGAGGGLAQMNAPEGTLIAYATAPGKVASDGSGRNGLYTTHLLKAIGEPGLAIEQVFKKVRSEVSRDSNGNQTPWEASSLIGDFYFRPGTTVGGSDSSASVTAPTPTQDRVTNTVRSQQPRIAGAGNGEGGGATAFELAALDPGDEAVGSALRRPNPRHDQSLGQGPNEQEPRPSAEAAVTRLRQAAEAGNAKAQVALGRFYARGRGGQEQNFAEAAKWFQKAADQGEPLGFVGLGQLHRSGRGLPQDPAKAAEWFRKAAERGNPQGQTALGQLYRSGQGVPRDFQQAMNYFRQAADQKHPPAQAALGTMYLNPKIGKPDPAQAEKLLREAAVQGEPLGQAGLGHLYETGHGVPRNLTEAVFWYRKAAEKGNRFAQARLAKLNGGPEGEAGPGPGHPRERPERPDRPRLRP